MHLLLDTRRGHLVPLAAVEHPPAVPRTQPAPLLEKERDAFTSATVAQLARPLSAHATSQYSDQWAERVRKARSKLDGEYLRLLDRLAGLETRRSELRAVGAWLTARATPGVNPKLVALPGLLDARDPRHSDSRMATEHAISLIRAYVEGSTVEAEEAQQRAREEAERLAEQRRERMREARAGIIEAH